MNDSIYHYCKQLEGLKDDKARNQVVHLTGDKFQQHDRCRISLYQNNLMKSAPINIFSTSATKRRTYDTGSNYKINGKLKERTKRTYFIVFEIDER